MLILKGDLSRLQNRRDRAGWERLKRSEEKEWRGNGMRKEGLEVRSSTCHTKKKDRFVRGRTVVIVAYSVARPIGKGILEIVGFAFGKPWFRDGTRPWFSFWFRSHWTGFRLGLVPD